MGTLYRQRRAGVVVLHGNGGVFPGMSDKTNGLPTDDMNAGGHPDKVLPREASLGHAGEERRLLRDPQNSSGNTAEAGATNAAPPSRESFRERMK